MNALTITDYSFSYSGSDKRILSGVSMCLEEGSFSLLVGSTGSGKTTLLRSVKPELATTGNRIGSIEVFGRDAKCLSVRESAALVGYVAQNPENQIVCDEVWHELAFGLENLGIAEDEMRRRVAEAAYFFGIEPLMHAKTASLSGGQKQAVTLASILVMQPKLLLLDEPTAQLDPVAEKNFLHALFRINRELGITVLVATHAPETMVSYATGAYRIESGHVVSAALDEFMFGCEEVQAVEPYPEPAEGARQVAPAVVCKDGYFRYEQRAPWVLRGMDLRIEPASIHAIIGGNGSGKSTILKAIAGTLKLQRGSIKNRHTDFQVLLPQYPKTLFVCDSVEEELEEWRERSGYNDLDIAEAVATFGLGDHLKQHPYDLSGGQQQKLALAKLLLTKPKLMLLDEPTKGLDPESKCEIAKIVLAVRKKGVTIVLVTHDLAFTSQVADTATMVFDGQATCTESVAAFFSRNIFYRPRPDGFLRRWEELRHL